MCTALLRTSPSSRSDPQRIEEDQRVDRFQRPRLPGRDLLQHRVGHRADLCGSYCWGRPGGKGTQRAAGLAKYGVPQVSSGDLLRDAVARKTELGLEVKAVRIRRSSCRKTSCSA